MANKKIVLTKSKDYISFLQDVKNRITNARIKAYKSLNKELIKLYWDIGKSIVEKQEKYGWGKSIVENLSIDLRKEFSGVKGYSSQNLWYMRQFYLEYKNAPNLQQLVGEIPWGQNLVILSRVKNIKDREFYIKGTIQFGWSRDVLIHQIEAEAHKQIKTIKLHNFPKTLPAHLSEQADLTMKDTYTLDFLDIAKPLLERELERKLLENLKKFLTELGYGFCFIGNQYKIELNDKEYYIDLLFYHRYLHCLVAIDLKIGEFKPEYAGKMNLYLNLLDEKIKLPEENSSIGIIICKDRDRLEVEYTLKGINKPIGVSKYKITKKLPIKLQKQLPTQKDIKKGLKE
jgi:predicted nuclease of restriction endonuclease-like (RecB) superfamily